MGSGMFLPEGGSCVEGFSKNGGCELWAAGDNPEKAIPSECHQHHHCQEEAMVHCAAEGVHGPDGAEAPKDCHSCAAEFASNGGCQVWRAGEDPSQYIPEGCDDSCKDEAELECALLEEVEKALTKMITQSMHIDGITEDQLDDAALAAYAMAMAMQEGLYDEETHEIKAGSTV